MKMCGAPWCGRDFAPSVERDPVDEFSRSGGVTGIAQENAQEEPDVCEEVVNLLLERMTRAEEITMHLAIDFQNKRGFGFDVGVVGGEVVGEQLAVLENGVDGIAEESGVTAQFPDDGPVGGTEFTGNDVARFGHVGAGTLAGRIERGKS